MLQKVVLCFSFVFVTHFFYGQTSQQKKLERQRSRLQQEIASVNKLLFTTQKEGQDLLSSLEYLNKKIQVRSDLIKAITAEANYLQLQVEKNKIQLNQLKQDLDRLKKDYARMILQSYKSKSEQSKLMFLLSSQDFFQAYKRFRYMKQYAGFRKKQGDSIVVKSEKIKILKRALEQQRRQKESLVNKNKVEAQKIKLEKKGQEALVQKVKSKEKLYLSQIREKQKEERKLEKEIERVIREAITNSNKKTSKKINTNVKSSGFTLTPESKALASRFEKNRGGLPWPVSEGVVTRRYGVIPHPTLRGIKIDSKGIHITTKKSAIARSIFKGKVLAIQTVSGRRAVYIQHGNYISLYNNLDNVYVTKGQEVVLKQSIGTVFTDKVTGKTILKFQIWKDTQRQNPRYWLAKM